MFASIATKIVGINNGDMTENIITDSKDVIIGEYSESISAHPSS